jgi:hypothetical protein
MRAGTMKKPKPFSACFTHLGPTFPKTPSPDMGGRSEAVNFGSGQGRSDGNPQA